MSRPLDPTAVTPDLRVAQKLRDLEVRVDRLENKKPALMVAGAPTANTGDGEIMGDTTNSRLWLRLNGIWKYTTLS